jgi:hypothetical protein
MVSSRRVMRLVAEHLPADRATIMAAARQVGFVTKSDIPPFHLRLLNPAEPFR